MSTVYALSRNSRTRVPVGHTVGSSRRLRRVGFKQMQNDLYESYFVWMGSHCLLFDVSYHVPRLGVSRQSCNKDSRAAAPFSFVDTFEPSTCRFESHETACSGDSVWTLPLVRAGRGLRCEARWVWLRRMFPAVCRDLCCSASAYERDGGACFCTAASRIMSLSSLSGSPVLLARSTQSIA